MTYTRKTFDTWEVQGNYGYGHGWEDVYSADSHKDARERLKEYRENEPQYRHRLKLVRRKIDGIGSDHWRGVEVRP